MYKKILVTSGVVSSLLLTGAATTFAQTGMINQVKDTRPMHRMITAERIADMATKLGLNADEIQQELDAGKKLPEILQQHNITKEQMDKLFPRPERPKLTDEQLADIATKLSLNLDEIKSEIAAGKDLHQILKAHNITPEQMESIFPHPQPSDEQIADIATKLGLDAAVIKQELASGKKLPEILKAHNITDEQLKTVFGERKGGFGKSRGMMMLKMSPEILEVQASILGISTDELQTAFKNRETLKSIIEGKGLTMETFHQKVNEQIKQMITEGKITGTQAELLQKMIEHKGKMPKQVSNS